jgi:DNA-binding MarR family transcriptional regulator
MPADAPVTSQDCNHFAVRSAARHVTQFYDQFLAPIGLRTSQFSILSKLNRLEPLTVNALAKEMAMDRTTLSRNVQPLERDGLIRTGPVASDRRGKALRLTNAGKKRVQAGLNAWAQAQAQFESSFGTKRAAELRALLRSVVAIELAPAHQSANR